MSENSKLTRDVEKILGPNSTVIGLIKKVETLKIAIIRIADFMSQQTESRNNKYKNSEVILLLNIIRQLKKNQDNNQQTDNNDLSESFEDNYFKDYLNLQLVNKFLNRFDEKNHFIKDAKFELIKCIHSDSLLSEIDLLYLKIEKINKPNLKKQEAINLLGYFTLITKIQNVLLEILPLISEGNIYLHNYSFYKEKSIDVDDTVPEIISKLRIEFNYYETPTISRLPIFHYKRINKIQTLAKKIYDDFSLQEFTEDFFASLGNTLFELTPFYTSKLNKADASFDITLKFIFDTYKIYSTHTPGIYISPNTFKKFEDATQPGQVYLKKIEALLELSNDAKIKIESNNLYKEKFQKCFAGLGVFANSIVVVTSIAKIKEEGFKGRNTTELVVNVGQVFESINTLAPYTRYKDFITNQNTLAKISGSHILKKGFVFLNLVETAFKLNDASSAIIKQDYQKASGLSALAASSSASLLFYSPALMTALSINPFILGTFIIITFAIGLYLLYTDKTEFEKHLEFCFFGKKTIIESDSKTPNSRYFRWVNNGKHNIGIQIGRFMNLLMPLNSSGFKTISKRAGSLIQEYEVKLLIKTILPKVNFSLYIAVIGDSGNYFPSKHMILLEIDIKEKTVKQNLNFISNSTSRLISDKSEVKYDDEKGELDLKSLLTIEPNGQKIDFLHIKYVPKGNISQNLGLNKIQLSNDFPLSIISFTFLNP